MLAKYYEKKFGHDLALVEYEIPEAPERSDLVRLESDMDGWDYVFSLIAALASVLLSTNKDIEAWLAEIHDVANGQGGGAGALQKVLGKILEHDHDDMDWFKTRTDGEVDSWRLFHRLFWGHDPLSSDRDNPFLLMFNQAKGEGRSGLWGVLQAARHLVADTFSRQGLPLPGSSHFDYELENGRPWNHFIDVVQQLSAEAYGNKMQAEPLYEHLLTIRAQDMAGGMAVCAIISAYLKARGIEDELRVAQVKLVAYSGGFFMQAAVGAARQKGVPYVNVPLGAATAKAFADLLIRSNLETRRLAKETDRLLARKGELLAESERLKALLADEF